MKYIVLLLAATSGCAAYHQEQSGSFLMLQARAKSICEVMAEPGLYVGRRLTIKGTYFAEPHQRLLTDKNCSQLNLRVSHSFKVKGNSKAEAIIERFRRKHPTVRVPVVYSAILVDRIVETGCTEPSCYDYSLQDARLLAAFPQIMPPRR